MIQIIWMILLNLIVGVCIGLTGIAGFLLPMFYTGFMDMGSSEALALSFAAFLISGVLGARNYRRSGHLDMRVAAWLSGGSLAGALIGVRINLLIPEGVIRLILYIVVLLSGLSILLREWAGGKSKDRPETSGKAEEKAIEHQSKANRTKQLRWQRMFYVVLGLVTGAVCAASGAGGPVLVMPLLTLLGIPAHTAVGISLFDSIFIALPSIVGYVWAAQGQHRLFAIMPLLLLAHGIGVYYGSKNGTRIDQKMLKQIVAVLSFGIACWKLFF